MFQRLLGLRRMLRLPKAARRSHSRLPAHGCRPRLEALEERLAPVTRIWSGTGGDTNWSNAGNWGGTGVPVGGDDVQFPFTTFTTSNNDLASGLALSAITFDTTASGYTLTGNAISLTGDINANNTAGGNRINFSINLTGSVPLVTVAAGGALTVAGVLSGAIASVSKGGGGELVLIAANTFPGGLSVSAGTLTVGNNAAAGTGSLSLSGGVTLQTDGSPRTLANPYSLGGGAAITFAGTSDLTLSANSIITFGGRTLNVTNTGQTTLSGNISGASIGTSLTKAGPGTLVLSGTNTYGPTTVNAGRLLVNGLQAASDMTVNAGATLGGTGTIGNITSAGGTISPGLTPGILTSQGVTLNAASTFVVELNGTTAGTGHDQLDVRGAVTLGGSMFSASLGFASAVGNSFMILNNDAAEPIPDTFAGLAEGAQFTLGGRRFQITYQGGSGNDVVLTHVNTLPTLSGIAVTSPINEGATATLTGTITDPDTLDTFTLVVTWGDGSPSDTINLPAGTTSFSVTHVYRDNPTGVPTFAIGLALADSNGGQAAAGASVTVNNVAPANVALSLSANPISENGSVTLTGSFTDPGVLDTFTVNINWGDGGPNTTVNLAAGVTSFSASHQYLDNRPGNAPYTITATVTDKDAGSGSATASLTVNNVAPSTPTLNLSAAPINENSSVTLTGSFTDPGTLDTFTVVISWGDGTPNTTVSLSAGVVNFSASHQYLDNRLNNAPFTISVTVTDKDNGSGSASTTLVVSNVDPAGVQFTNVVSTQTPGNTAFSFTGVFTDPGTLDTHTVAINWGDGSPNTTLTLAANVLTFTAAHQFASPSLAGTSFTVTVVVTDKDSGSGSAQTTVAVLARPCTPNEFFVTALYRDVLERAPDLQGLAAWVAQLNAGVSRAQVGAAFWLSAEHRGFQVDQFYQLFLGRAADATGRAGWVNALLGGLSEVEVVVGFVTSPEYTARHATNRAYVDGLYEDLLDRLGDSEGVAFWEAILRNNARRRDAVAYYFLSSPEAYDKAVEDYYRFFLGRAPDAQGRQNALNVIESGSNPVMIVTVFLGSDEYFQRAQGRPCP